ncbi:MAG: PAS domain S-box protein [Desulfobacterales bacterium]|nr:PAS domain S-box protein [Desulfobacterales bacterium]
MIKKSKSLKDILTLNIVIAIILPVLIMGLVMLLKLSDIRSHELATDNPSIIKAHTCKVLYEIKKVFIISMLSSTTFAFLMTFIILKKIFRPLIKLIKDSQRVANGEYDSMHPSKNCYSELKILANTINAMIWAIKGNEELASKSENRYRTIFDDTNQCIFQTTLDGKFINANKAAAKMFEYNSPEELMISIDDIGKQIYVNQDDRKRIIEIIKKHGFVENFEFQFYTKYNKKKWGSINVVSIKDLSGNIIHFNGMINDITYLKETEEELRQSEMRYRKMAEENAYLLEQARKDAEIKKLLMQEINHRVKNNLSAIIGIFYAEENYATNESLHIYRNILKHMANRIKGMMVVHNMLSDSEWAPVPLKTLANKIIHGALQMLPTNKEAIVNIEGSSVIKLSPKLSCNIAIVIHELITNTIKYAFQEREQAVINVSFDLAEENRVLFQFKDNGPGYPVDVLTLKKHNVGFYLIKNLVQIDMEGHLTLQNKNGAIVLIKFNTM